jgi:hypothetical protein
MATVSKHSKQIASNQQKPWFLLLLGLVCAAITYGIISWTIDSGRIALYFATFASTYVTIRLLKTAVTLIRK